MAQKDFVSMRELQKLSAGAIRALTHPVSIRSGDDTVGLLVPLRRANLDELRRAEELAEDEARHRSQEETAAIEKMLDDRDFGRAAPKRLQKSRKAPPA